jgi:hypothetical protein
MAAVEKLIPGRMVQVYLGPAPERGPRRYWRGVIEKLETERCFIRVTERGNYSLEIGKVFEIAFNGERELLPICPQKVYRDWAPSSGACGVELKRAEHLEANLCGLHLGVQKRAARKAEERRAQDERAAQERKVKTARRDVFNEALGVNATVGYGDTLVLSLADAEQLLNLVADLREGKSR